MLKEKISAVAAGETAAAINEDVNSDSHIDLCVMRRQPKNSLLPPITQLEEKNEDRCM